MKLKAVLFDVDGVLYDSMPLHARSWIAAFKKEAGIRIPARFVYEAEGTKDRNTILFIVKRLGKKPLSKSVVEAIRKEKVRLFDSYSKPKFIPGAKRFVKTLQRKGIRTGFVTGSSQSKTLARLKRDFSVLRSVIVTGKDVRKGKPHPEPYLTGLKKLKVNARETLTIENAPLGIRSSRRAGIRSFAINTGPIPASVLKKEGAIVVVRNFKELARTLASEI